MVVPRCALELVHDIAQEHVTLVLYRFVLTFLVLQKRLSVPFFVGRSLKY